MKENHLWNRASAARIHTGPEITGGFSIGFDRNIPETTRDALIRFVYWVEDRFSLPVTLWVDFKYNHYLMSRDKKRVGYLFYWVDFADYPNFLSPDDIPVIELPVRLEHSTPEEVLTSFVEAISLYYTWLLKGTYDGAKPDELETEAVLQQYFLETGGTGHE